MQSARIPENEDKRLTALRAYDVLDTLPEQGYDDLTFLASQICGTPIALISLVDEARQWFKSKVGLEANETSRDLAFCAHAILEPEELFVVADAAEDERFSDSPLVQDGPKIRFYAGAPLVTPEGAAIGTLCVIDQRPRRLNPEQAKALSALSRQVVTQLELRAAIGDLEAKAFELEVSRQEVVRSNKDLEQFASIAAHDLDAPLRQIKSFSELLEEELGDRLNGEQLECFEFIGSTADRGRSLIRDILAYSRLSADEEVESVDLNRLLAEIRDDLERADSKGVLEWQELPVLMGHAGPLRRLCENLIRNGFKYNENQAPTIRVTAGSDASDEWLRFTDDGIGIPEELQSRVFEMFYRADADPGRKGTGVGLAICQRVMELHGGRIEVTSGPDGGSVFTCHFPIERLLER